MSIRCCLIQIVVLLLLSVPGFAQDATLKQVDRFYKKSYFYDTRGTNALEAAVGTAIINGDLPDPAFDIASRFGYKRFVTPHFNVGLVYSKFNLVYKDVYNQGFMAFDLNIEYVMWPYKGFSPFLFAGGGYNASNYFEQTAAKLQGGGGMEVMLARQFGLKLLANYNYVFSDELDGLVGGQSDDAYWQLLLGINLYFGGQKAKARVLKDVPSVIKSNPIIREN